MSIDSQYLHMSTPPINPSGSIQHSYMNTQESSDYAMPQEPDDRYFQKKVSMIEPDELSADDESLVSSPQDKYGYSLAMDGTSRLRLRSRSCDDLRNYAIEMTTYENETFKISDEANVSETDKSTVYSYTNPRDEHMKKPLAYSGPAYMNKHWPTTQPSKHGGNSASVIRRKSPYLMQEMSKNKGIRKSLSNPDLLDDGGFASHQPALPRLQMPQSRAGNGYNHQPKVSPNELKTNFKPSYLPGNENYRGYNKLSSPPYAAGSQGNNRSQETPSPQNSPTKSTAQSPLAIEGVQFTARSKSYKKPTAQPSSASPTNSPVSNMGENARNFQKWNKQPRGVTDTVC